MAGPSARFKPPQPFCIGVALPAGQQQTHRIAFARGPDGFRRSARRTIRRVVEQLLRIGMLRVSRHALAALGDHPLGFWLLPWLPGQQASFTGNPGPLTATRQPMTRRRIGSQIARIFCSRPVARAFDEMNARHSMGSASGLRAFHRPAAAPRRAHGSTYAHLYASSWFGQRIGCIGHARSDAPLKSAAQKA